MKHFPLHHLACGVVQLIVLLTGLATQPASAEYKKWKHPANYAPPFIAPLWSNPDLWDPPGVPQDGDILMFIRRPATTTPVMTNDLTNVTIGGLLFDNWAAIETDSWFLEGNTLVLSNKIDVFRKAPVHAYIRCGIKLAGDAIFIVGATTDIFYRNLELHINGPIDLNGDKLNLTGNNSFNGAVVIQEGRVELGHDNALGTPVGATLMAGGELLVRDSAIGQETHLVNTRSPVTANIGSHLSVSGTSSWAGPIVLNTNLVLSGENTSFSGSVSGPGR